MARHVSERAGAEVPPAAPGERMVVVAIGTLFGRPKPEVPIQARGYRLLRRALDALRPDRPVGPDVHLFDGPECAGADTVGISAHAVASRALVTHLRDDL